MAHPASVGLRRVAQDDQDRTPDRASPVFTAIENEREPVGVSAPVVRQSNERDRPWPAASRSIRVAAAWARGPAVGVCASRPLTGTVVNGKRPRPANAQNAAKTPSTQAAVGSEVATVSPEESRCNNDKPGSATMLGTAPSGRHDLRRGAHAETEGRDQ